MASVALTVDSFQIHGHTRAVSEELTIWYLHIMQALQARQKHGYISFSRGRPVRSKSGNCFTTLLFHDSSLSQSKSVRAGQICQQWHVAWTRTVMTRARAAMLQQRHTQDWLSQRLGEAQDQQSRQSQMQVPAGLEAQAPPLALACHCHWKLRGAARRSAPLHC